MIIVHTGEGKCRDFCVAAAAAMFEDEAIRHTSYVTNEDLEDFLFPEDYIMRVRIDWIHKDEAE